MCFEKSCADFFVSTFHGEVLGKSRGSQLPSTGSLGLIRQLGLDVIYLLEGSWYKSVGKLVTSTQIRKAVSMLFERAQQSLNDEKTNDGSCSWLMRNLIWPISELWNSAF